MTSIIYRALGLMSGTSYDAIDVGLIETDGQEYVKILDAYSHQYPDSIRRGITKLLEGKLDDIWQIEYDLSQAHVHAAREIISATKVDVIGFHGQTIYHNPAKKITVQIGNPHVLCAATGLDVVYDFRRKDVVCGGQGAPLVPAFLKAIRPYHDRPVCFLNIGGVSNICYIDDTPLAFDIGPGNAPLNDICKKHLGIEFDDGGKVAAGGVVDQALLKLLISNDYFARAYPKSLDRNHFDFSLLGKLATADALATVVEFIAQATYMAIQMLPKLPHEIIISGGGVHNEFLLSRISAVTGIKLVTSDQYDIPADFLEAYAFGYLAVRSLLGLPISFPTTTGVGNPTTGGVLIKNK